MSDLSRDHPDFTKLNEYKDLETELEITEENMAQAIFNGDKKD